VEGITSDVQLVWLDRAGNRLGTLGSPTPYRQIALSPDGTHVAAVAIAGTGLNDIWAIDAASGMTNRVTTGPRGAFGPVWSPDSKELIFAAGNLFYRKEPRADATEYPLQRRAVCQTPEDWSHDGKTLLCSTSGEKNAIWALPVEGDGAPELVVESEFSLSEARMSPDGRWLAYTSNETERNEVYVRPFRRPGERRQVSRDGGSQPEWGRGDEHELFYRAAGGQLMAVDIPEGASGLEVLTPDVLVPADALKDVVGAYAVTADGQRFLVRMRVEGDFKQRIHVVMNWSSSIVR
jgi:Tol biopolymer transport system component